MPASYLVLLALHFLGLALGVGTGFAMLRLGIASAALDPAERRSFMLRVMPVSKNGSIGFLLLVLTGLGMLFMRGPASVFAGAGPAFHVKLTLVLIMAGVLGYTQMLQKRARSESGGAVAMAALPKAGAALLLLGVGIVIAAVIAFQ